jgi:tRNA(Ile)-lysidine synthase
MDLLSSFTATITEGRYFTPQDKLLLAVSGGLDSVVLCDLCHRAGYDFVIAHCNFGLRGEESVRDQLFVESLGPRYGKPVLVKQFDTERYASEHSLSIQETARELRYRWFFELIGESHETSHVAPSRILTAHHAGDNAETILMNLARGAGLHGLTGIPARSAGNRLLRPLLGLGREKLAAYAKEQGLSWVEDSSNASVKYTRNLFRHEVLPAIEKAYPAAMENINAAARRLLAVEQVYLDGIAAIRKKLYKQTGGDTHIPIKQFLSYNNTAVWYELIKDFGFTEKQVDEVVKLCHSASGAWLESPASAQEPHRLIRHRNWLIAAPRRSGLAETIVINEYDNEVAFPDGSFLLETKPAGSFTIPSASTQACLDARHIQYPLLLRRWKAGDYFYPLGMTKKKKLARFFIDKKLSKTDKERVWVLEMNKKIVWVAGHRIDDRYKITPSTKEMLKITLVLSR